MIRANRATQRRVDDEDEQKPLWDYLPARPLSGTCDLAIPGRGGRKARVAALEIRCAPIRLRPPWRLKASPAVPLWAVHAVEPDPPEGSEAVPVGQFWVGGELLQQGGGGVRVAGEQGPGHGEGEASGAAVVLAAVAAVGEVRGDGPLLGPGRGVAIAGVGLDVGEDVSGLPGLGGVAERRLALDGPADLAPRLVETGQPAQGRSEVASNKPFVGRIFALETLARRLSEEDNRFLGETKDIVVKDPHLGQRGRLLCAIAEPNRDGEGL